MAVIDSEEVHRSLVKDVGGEDEAVLVRLVWVVGNKSDSSCERKLRYDVPLFILQ